MILERAAVLLSVLALAGEARAAEPGDAEVTARLAWTLRVLEREEPATRLWYDTWLGIYGGATALELGLAGAAPDGPTRLVDLVEAGKSAVACGFLRLSPATGRTAASLLRAAPEDTPAARLSKLRRAEGLLRAIATEERDGRSWFPLIGGALLNGGAAWVEWAGAHKAASSWLNLVAGVAVANVQVFTQPTYAWRAWDAYRRAGYRDVARVAPAPGGFALAVSGDGLLLRGSF